MSISNNRKRGKPLFVLSGCTGAFIVALAMLAYGFPLLNPLTVSATPSNSTNSTATGIALSTEPVYKDHLRVVSQNPINETHMSITFSGNGTLTLPNSTQTVINTTSNGSALISFMTLSVQGTETIRTQDGDETATATLYEIDRQPATSGESKGIVIAVFNTTSTSGVLAPLNSMILAGIDDIQTTTSESSLTLWEWKSGIGNNTGVASSYIGR